MTAILGLNAYHGDAAAALVVDGELVAPPRRSASTASSTAPASRRSRPPGASPTPGSRPDDLDHVAIARDPKANLGAQAAAHAPPRAPAPRYLKARLENAAQVRDVEAPRSTEALGVERGRARSSTTSSTTRPTSRARSSSRRSRTRRSSRSTASATSPRRCSPRGTATVVRGARARPLPALARDLLHRGHAVARLPALRRRGQGDGPRAVRRRRATSTRCASSSSSTATVFELGLDYFTHDKEGVDMTWDERHADDRPDLLRADGARCSARRASPTRELTALHEDVAASLQAMLEEAYLHLVAHALGADADPEPLPRRRRRAERGRERAHPARDAVRGASSSSRPRATPGPRSAPRSTSGTRCSAARAASSWSTPTPGPEYSDAEMRGGARRGRARGRAARRRRALRARSPSGSPTATSSAGSRAGWSSGRARSATARSSPTRAGPT